MRVVQRLPLSRLRLQCSEGHVFERSRSCLRQVTRCPECRASEKAALAAAHRDRPRIKRESTPAPPRKLRIKRRAAGLCRQCDEPAEPNRALCKPHLEQHKEYQNKLNAHRRAHGLCIVCGATAVVDDRGAVRSRCHEHLVRAAQLSRRRRRALPADKLEALRAVERERAATAYSARRTPAYFSPPAGREPDEVGLAGLIK